MFSFAGAAAENLLVCDPLGKFEPLQAAPGSGRDCEYLSMACREQKRPGTPSHPLLPKGAHPSGIPKVFWGRRSLY